MQTQILRKEELFLQQLRIIQDKINQNNLTNKKSLLYLIITKLIFNNECNFNYFIEIDFYQTVIQIQLQKQINPKIFGCHMGNDDSKPTTSSIDWQKVDTENEIQIYCNKKTNQLAEKRMITVDPHHDLNDQLKIYNMRQHNRDALVRTFGSQDLDKRGGPQGLCSGHKRLFVLTEKMPYRISQLPQLTFPQSLLFLGQSLKAYSKVFKSYGPIYVTKQLIGINQFGEVKCWVNQNWALNHPDHDFASLHTTKLQDLTKEQFLAYGAKYLDQTQMVYNLVGVIEQKCQQGKFPQAFSEQVKLHSSSFKKLMLYLQDFINQNQVFVPSKINYEAVFLSKYQARLVEQYHLAGQNSQKNRGVIVGDQNARQQQGNVMTGDMRNATGYMNGSIGYQQQQANNYGYGFSLNSLASQKQMVVSSQGQQHLRLNNTGYGLQHKHSDQESPSSRVIEGYTNNNTANTNTVTVRSKTNAYVSGMGVDSIAIGTASNQGSSLHNALKQPSTASSIWTNTQTIYKPGSQLQQNKHITLHNHHITSALGGDSTNIAKHHQFQRITSTTPIQTSLKYGAYKPPSSYSTLNLNNTYKVNYHVQTKYGSNYGLVGGSFLGQNVVTPYSNSSDYQERTVFRAYGLNNITTINNVISTTTNNVATTNNLSQHKDVKYYGESHQGQLVDGITEQRKGGNQTLVGGNISSYGGLKSGLGALGLGSSYRGYTSTPSSNQYATYTSSYNTSGYIVPAYNSSVQKISAQSFDSKSDFNYKIGMYQGSVHSNTLNKHETITGNNISGGNNDEAKVQGKYIEEFYSLLETSLKNNHEDGPNTGQTVTTNEKIYSTAAQNSHAGQNLDQGQTGGIKLVEAPEIVEATGNAASESTEHDT